MVRHNKMSKFIALLLAVVMLIGVFPIQALASDEINLKNGSAKITADMTTEQVKEALFKALVANPEGKDAQSIEWEYGCDGKFGPFVNWAYGSIEGFQSKVALSYYDHPALKDNADGTYNVRIKGTENFVRLTKTNEDVTTPETPDTQISLKDGSAVITSDMTTEQVKEVLFNTLVANPEGKDAQSIEWEYGCDGKNGLLVNWAYGSIEGFQSKKALTYYDHPALKDIENGTYNIRIKGAENYVRFTKIAEETTEPETPDVPVVKVVLKDGVAKITSDMTTEQVKTALYDALVVNKDEVDAQSIEWEYGCDGKNGLLINWAYGSIEGFQSKKALTYYDHPALKDIADGGYNVRVKGSEEFVKLTKTTKDFVQSNIVLKENYGNIALYLNDDLSTNFARFSEDLFNTVYDAEKSTPGTLTAKDVTFQYDASRLDTIPIWQNLDYVDPTNIQKSLAECGTFKFKMTVPETESYYGTSIEFTATVENAVRVDSKIEFTNKTINYLSDAEALRDNIFSSVIDWKKSVLPNSEEYGKEYYTIEYFAENLVAGKPGGTKRWVPLEGGTFSLLYYPAISAGENQIRITFKGNSTHTSASLEQAVTIKKARTFVNVKSTEKFADEKFPADFVTTSSKDPFQIFTIFIGTTSSVTGNLCIDLPDSITESFLIDLLNPIVKLVIGKSMDDIINNGITLGELNAVLNSQSFKDFVAAFHIDLGAIGTVLDILDKLPPSLQKFNISFSEPNVAGMYNVVALAINPNYETGVGVGMAVVKMRNVGTKLAYNQKINRGKITVEEAKNFDFTATLTHQGIAVSQKSVHYLYTGIKSNGRPYISTTEAPREAGIYTETVVILGGNYMAAPQTRTFRIVK